MAVDVEERTTIAVPPAEVYAAVSDVRRMGKRAAECFATWVWSRRDGRPARFVGWNRRGGFVWFTTCRVVIADPGEEFAFDVLAHLADDKRSLKLLPKGNCSSRHHDQVAPFLRQLADAIETAK